MRNYRYPVFTAFDTLYLYFQLYLITKNRLFQYTKSCIFGWKKNFFFVQLKLYMAILVVHLIISPGNDKKRETTDYEDYTRFYCFFFAFIRVASRLFFIGERR
jgi:hypothetical protein